MRKFYFSLIAACSISAQPALANRCDTLWDVPKTTCIWDETTKTYYQHKCKKSGLLGKKVSWYRTGLTCGQSGKR